MAAAPHPLRDEAIATAQNLVAFHGQEEGERLARAKYAAIPKGTFSGWLKLARRPAEPPSMPAPRSSGSTGADGAPLTFEERISKMDRQADLIAAQCMTEVVDPMTGGVTVKAKNLAMLATAVRLQAVAAELLVKHHSVVFNQEQTRELYDAVIEAVGEVDRSLQQAVMTKLRDLSERRGRARFGIGVAPATELADF
ncbi:hypothetical protein [Paraburkholderia sp. SIMBA_053]|uniref:hypothetical protein n=1 Tax=Paraburkholderia sp. SIMBA_053 TaxID=3085794 RepID=UPI0039798AC4